MPRLPHPAIQQSLQKADMKADILKMNLSNKQELAVFVVGFFAIVGVALLRISASAVGAKDVTLWRCIKAGLLGITAAAAGLAVAIPFNSLNAGLIAAGVVWMVWIHIMMKTNVLQTFGILVITYGTIFLVGWACNQYLFNVQDKIMQMVSR
jgi:hypothetical protein